MAETRRGAQAPRFFYVRWAADLLPGLLLRAWSRRIGHDYDVIKTG